MDILTAGDIADIREQIAPEMSDLEGSVIEVWRRIKPALAPHGGAGVGGLGTVVDNASRPDQKWQKLHEYPARILGGWQGDEEMFGRQMTNISRYTVLINGADEPDIQGGDRLKERRAVWAPGTVVEAGEVYQPSDSNGLAYRVILGGKTGAVEPEWPLSSVGVVVPDGEVTWALMGDLRTFEVKVPGGDTTYQVLRRVLVEEVQN